MASSWLQAEEKNIYERERLPTKSLQLDNCTDQLGGMMLTENKNSRNDGGDVFQRASASPQRLGKDGLNRTQLRPHPQTIS